MEEIIRFFKLNENIYNIWWEAGLFYAGDCKVATQEQNDSLMEKGSLITGEDASVTDQSGFSIFHYVVLHNFYDLAKLYIEKGVDINVAVAETPSCAYRFENMLGATPLHIASYLGNYKMVKLLLDAGANPASLDKKKRTPLHYLVMSSSEKMIRLDSARNNVINQKIEILSLLVSVINCEDENGDTPLSLLISGPARLSQFMFQPLIEAGASTTQKDSNGETFLMKAARANAISPVLVLINDKENINLKNNDGNTALHIALKENNSAVAYILADNGADLELENNQSETGKMLIENGWSDILKKKIKGRRELTQDDLVKEAEHAFFSCNDMDTNPAAYGLYIIKNVLKEIDDDDDDEVANLFKIAHLARIEVGSADIIQAIYDAGFDFNQSYTLRTGTNTLRDYILEYCSNSAVVKKMYDLGVDLDNSYVKGKTSAYIIADKPEANKFYEKESEAFGLVGEYFSPESAQELSADGLCALHKAAKNNHVTLLKTLINKGADINISEDAPATIGATALHEACKAGNVDVVEFLINLGADDTISTQDGETPAHFIVQEKQKYKPIKTEIREKIINFLKNVDIQRNDGKTPLILAQSLGYNGAKEITYALLDKGADVNIADNYGNTALIAHTENMCDKDVVKELIKSGADVNAKNQYGNTALHIALQNNRDMVARLLIKKGADYMCANQNGKTPMELAVEKGMETVLELMQI